MQTLICPMCKAARRTASPLNVHYMPLRGNRRRSFWVCTRCDMPDLWPVFTRKSGLVQET